MHLAGFADTQLPELMRWFGDARACAVWAGPGFRFPFDARSFREDLRLELPSFALVDAAGTLAGFGQYYLREGRCHLARLAIAPATRGRGAGAVLVRGLVERGVAALGVGECSLFVLASNTPARRLYARLGFARADYPGEMPALGDCLYLVAPAARLLDGPDAEELTMSTAAAGAAGVADTDRACVHTRLIDAPRERVFRAFADPARLARWWGPAGFRNTFELFEPCPGGAWRFVMHGPDGTDYPNESVLREFVPPERVVIEHLSEGHHFLLTIGFAAEGARTRVHWRQVFDTAEHRERIAQVVLAANEQNLDRLAAEVARTD